uniref:Uncharacterized protein n=1 Tax=Timema poppense TaxID=170557 RepID=A0A7R9CM97_TIMPO|nr:unnamed protein product [Timema poppensis]
MLQPLNRVVFTPFKAVYEQEVDKWLTLHPGRVVTTHQVAGLFNSEYMRLSTTNKGVEAFRVTKIHHFNPDTFTEEDFLAAYVPYREGDDLEELAGASLLMMLLGFNADLVESGGTNPAQIDVPTQTKKQNGTTISNYPEEYHRRSLFIPFVDKLIVKLEQRISQKKEFAFNAKEHLSL